MVGPTTPDQCGQNTAGNNLQKISLCVMQSFSVFFINSSDVEMYQAVVHNYEERQKVSYFNFRFVQLIIFLASYPENSV